LSTQKASVKKVASMGKSDVLAGAIDTPRTGNKPLKSDVEIVGKRRRFRKRKLIDDILGIRGVVLPPVCLSECFCTTSGASIPYFSAFPNRRRRHE